MKVCPWLNQTQPQKLEAVQLNLHLSFMADIQQLLFSLDCFMSEDEGTVTLQTLAAAKLTTTSASQKT